MLSWLRRLLGSGKSTASAEIGADGAPDYQTPDAAFTRPARWDDVLTTTRLLNAAGVDYALVGGYALAAHGHVRMTQDVDIAVAVDPDNTRRWIRALAALPDGVSLELADEADPFEGDHLHGIRLNDEFTVDILPSVAGISFAELAVDGFQIVVPLRVRVGARLAHQSPPRTVEVADRLVEEFAELDQAHRAVVTAREQIPARMLALRAQIAEGLTLVT